MPSRLRVLLGEVLPQWGEGEEVALVAEPPADVPLKPLLAFPPGVAPEDAFQKLVLVFIDLLDSDGVIGGIPTRPRWYRQGWGLGPIC